MRELTLLKSIHVQCDGNTLTWNTRVKYVDVELDESLTGAGVAKNSLPSQMTC